MVSFSLFAPCCLYLSISVSLSYLCSVSLSASSPASLTSSLPRPPKHVSPAPPRALETLWLSVPLTSRYLPLGPLSAPRFASLPSLARGRFPGLFLAALSFQLSKPLSAAFLSFPVLSPFSSRSLPPPDPSHALSLTLCLSLSLSSLFFHLSLSLRLSRLACSYYLLGLA